MEFRTLGGSGAKASVIALGTWLSHDGGESAHEAIKTTRRAYELGVNLFDTANEYQHGRAEEVLGEALRGVRRESFMVATKVCYPMGDTPLDSGLSRKHIMGQVDLSLRRLGLDYIDLYQCHDFDRETPVDETARAMNDLVASGKIIYWGVSNWDSEQLRRVVTLCRERNWVAPVTNQLQYSALWRLIEKRILPTCRELDVGVLSWSPLAMGVLTGKYTSGAPPESGTRAHKGVGKLDWLLAKFTDPQVLRAVETARSAAAEAGLSLAEAAVRWCLREAAVASVVTGASSPAQVEQNVAAGDLTPPVDLFDEIDRILRPVEARPPAWYPGVSELSTA
ncbi:aldo/keto reductase [Jiangella asiatica]|uniref:Aldo/keto reductase n=1 Tax=Jiangella asiatica TaxID=2530372 RepID=A0A4R5C759_9ACTN|nr:aldo/keto reductase [Jiangella asiatica]TDD94386.1 aldo/keto reductase [Jiangella asiatica]